MTVRREVAMTSGHEDGMRVAIRHFPARAAEIQTLIGESERFREMCAELAAAEDALAAVGRLDEGLRGERRLEWLSFIRSSLEEIERELRRITVLPMTRNGPED
jgi:hypothetical protein